MLDKLSALLTRQDHPARMLLTSLLLLVICLGVYGHSLPGEFMLDDNTLLAAVQGADTRSVISEAFRPTIHYRPLARLYGFVLVQLLPNQSLYFRLFNIFLFWIISILVVQFWHGLTGEGGTALLAGLIFCVHPLNSTAVNFISSTSLLLTLVALGSLRTLDLALQQRNQRLLFMSLLLFVMALLIHEVAMMLPFYVLLLLGLWRQSGWKKTVRIFLIYLLITIGYGLYRIHAAGTTFSIQLTFEQGMRDFFKYMATMTEMATFFIAKFFISKNILLVWHIRPNEEFILFWNLILLIVFLVLVAIYRKHWRGNVSLFSLLWIFLGFLSFNLTTLLFPVFVVSFGIHRLFFISIGFFFWLAFLFKKARPYLHRAVWLSLFIALLCYFAIQTIQYNRLWQKEERYLKYWLSVDSNSQMANYWMAHIYFKQHQYEQARTHFRKVLEWESKDWESLINLGVIEKELDRPAAAAYSFHQALRINPQSADAHNNLATLYIRGGNDRKAETHLRAAIRLDEHLYYARVNLAYVLYRNGRPAEALKLLEENLRLNPDEIYSQKFREEILAAEKDPNGKGN